MYQDFRTRPCSLLRQQEIFGDLCCGNEVLRKRRVVEFDLDVSRQVYTICKYNDLDW